MRAQAARLVATALVGIFVGLGVHVALWNIDPVGHEDEPCSDFLPHLHLPFDLVLWG